MPAVLVVEYRDTVYHRLASDLDHAGLRVMRVYCASEGIIQYSMFRPDLVIANVELPDQSGWLLTAKLCVIEPQPHVQGAEPDAILLLQNVRDTLCCRADQAERDVTAHTEGQSGEC